MRIFRLATAALLAVAGAVAAQSSLPEIFTADPRDKSPWGDFSLRIESQTCGGDSTCIVRAKGLFHGNPVGIEVVLGANRNGKRGVLYRSAGPESDALLAAMASVYRTAPPSGTFTTEVWADAVVLEGSTKTIATSPLKMKVFFNANGPESKYAEMYTNVVPSRQALELFEKDESYRQPLLRALSK